MNNFLKIVLIMVVLALGGSCEKPPRSEQERRRAQACDSDTCWHELMTAPEDPDQLRGW